ncbi:MAG: hypothetical protein HKN76_18715 [Saprospiraceae bacterium]|nr:hypothetical protein [Saprospiraceae bacterium]
MHIVLFEESRKDIQISISAQIDTNGNFTLKGMDAGNLVKQMKGDWNYEYNIGIKKRDKEILIKELALENPDIKSDADFMHWLKLKYSHNEAYSGFAKLLQEMKIGHEVFIWP